MIFKKFLLPTFSSVGLFFVCTAALFRYPILTNSEYIPNW